MMAYMNDLPNFSLPIINFTPFYNSGTKIFLSLQFTLTLFSVSDKSWVLPFLPLFGSGSFFLEDDERKFESLDFFFAVLGCCSAVVVAMPGVGVVPWWVEEEAEEEDRRMEVRSGSIPLWVPAGGRGNIHTHNYTTVDFQHFIRNSDYCLCQGRHLHGLLHRTFFLFGG